MGNTVFVDVALMLKRIIEEYQKIFMSNFDL